MSERRHKKADQVDLRPLEPIDWGIDWFSKKNPFNTRPAVGDIVGSYVLGAVTESLVASHRASFVSFYKKSGGVTLEPVGKLKASRDPRGFMKVEWTYRIAALDPRWFEPNWDI